MWQRGLSPHTWGLRRKRANLLSEGNKVFPCVSLLCRCRRVAMLKLRAGGGCKHQLALRGHGSARDGLILGVTYRVPVGGHTTSVSGGGRVPSPGLHARLEGGSEGPVPCTASAAATQRDRGCCNSSEATEEPRCPGDCPVPAGWQGASCSPGACGTAKGPCVSFNAIPTPLFGDNPKEEYGCTAP